MDKGKVGEETRQELIGLGCRIEKEGKYTVVVFPPGIQKEVEEVFGKSQTELLENGIKLRETVYTGYGQKPVPPVPVQPAPPVQPPPPVPMVPPAVATEVMRPMLPSHNRAAVRGDLGGDVDDG